MGICTNCSKVVGDNEIHECNDHFVTLKNTDHKILKMVEDFLLTQPTLNDEQRGIINGRKEKRGNLAA